MGVLLWKERSKHDIWESIENMIVDQNALYLSVDGSAHCEVWVDPTL